MAAEHTLTFDANQVPMRCPPLPWLSPHMGGYLLSTTKLMRSVETTTQHQHLLAACAPGELHGALDTLTQLGNCAWRVNGPVLDLVLALFRDQGCPKLGVPAPVPRAPRACFPRLPPGTPPAHKAKLRSELARALKLAREQHGLRADALYRLSVAQHLRDHTFWLPHNMDFRGRTYPCPPHFNHLGSDLARALLQFAQGRPLGAHGLDWLKIHLVNLTGLKKRESLRGRLAFADTILDLVLDSADRPMKVTSRTEASHPRLGLGLGLGTLPTAPQSAPFLPLGICRPNAQPVPPSCPLPGPEVVDGGRGALADAGLLHGDCECPALP